MNALLVPVIAGPTAVGKTRVATALARLVETEIVSADSRQVYRRLDIGTAKPAAGERAAAPYHGLDLVESGERYSAGRFARDATGWIAGIAARGRLPLIVGGTGFYLRALFEGLFEEPAIDPARRERLRLALARLPAEEVARWAKRLDSGFQGGGAPRAARATEVALLTGQPLTALQRAGPAAKPALAPWYALLTLPRAVLAGRIAARTESMLAAGLVEEVRALLQAGVPKGAPGLTGVGYREAIRHLEGRLDESGLAAAIAQATRRYAKRQETWFRHQLAGQVVRFDASLEPETLAREVLSRYRAALRTLEPDHAS
ncbi:MAG: tRNA (adenosine(37)-N6)-dimethylallyltransferase MiaA [Gemmatimonadales bacterium]|nr:tRNA (adenosine(37)-N6)-dimethylallyltransferase MiaA [Gemmatimonadales bacterium]